MLAPAPEAPAITIGSELERDRLAHRINRMELVLRALKDRATLRSEGGDVPAPLREAIRDFSTELHALRGRFAEMAA